MTPDKSNRDSEHGRSAPAAEMALSRRAFLGRGIAATVAATSGVGLGSGALDPTPAAAEDIGPLTRMQRANRAYRVRQKAALEQRNAALVKHPNNGDEERYANRCSNFSKGLPCDEFGEVTPAAYDALLRALRTGDPQDFEAIPLGALSQSFPRKLVNPQSAFAFDLEGADSHALSMPPAPEFSSAEQAGEMIENYWMALTRDVPFTEYATHPLTNAAATDLSKLSDFQGPKIAGQVTPQTLFRDNLLGATTGPCVSQFLLLPVPFGANYIEQRMRTLLPGIDYMTGYGDWLSVQRGNVPAAVAGFSPDRCLIRNGRDLSQWVHIDVLFQAYFHALLILLTPPDVTEANSSGIGTPFDAGNPYTRSLNQDAFATFGGPHIASLMCEVSTRALKAAWFQKWCVHRRLRPEAFAGRVHHQLTGTRAYPLALDQVLVSAAPAAVYARHGTYLLPMAFPEGSPLHPSYAAGHATVAGACVTILKAWFDDSLPIPSPVVPSADGLSLIPYTGAQLTIGGELNKLASNVATGRNIAGMHWRSDAAESLQLGEAVAISLLRELRLTCNEEFDGFSLTKFDGTQITV